ncbi:hypothetical protein CUT44_20235 [Streptomyces carminius]|uniref:Methyltransferase domain-containing protein n=1 Tax=Streptomyces carminius TaxID=2665496 RepID=A0A2M8LVX3_9ACTN|nr:hypothetical protein CUT44_20235 [Streptomyces carminius]
MSETDTGAHTDRRYWRTLWDRQQESCPPGREERFRTMLDSAEALVGPGPGVLDPACGTGGVSDRLLRRFPMATSPRIGLGPALPAIARGYFAADSRVQFVRAGLRDPRWRDELPHRAYDAVLTSTAPHWLRTDGLRTLYGQLAAALRAAGFAEARTVWAPPSTRRCSPCGDGRVTAVGVVRAGPHHPHGSTAALSAGPRPRRGPPRRRRR